MGVILLLVIHFTKKKEEKNKHKSPIRQSFYSKLLFYFYYNAVNKSRFINFFFEMRVVNHFSFFFIQIMYLYYLHEMLFVLKCEKREKKNPEAHKIHDSYHISHTCSTSRYKFQFFFFEGRGNICVVFCLPLRL